MNHDDWIKAMIVKNIREHRKMGSTALSFLFAFRCAPGLISFLIRKPVTSFAMTEPKTAIAPMLAVSNGTKAVEFYKRAFDAKELWRINSQGSIVAGLSVGGANFFLADESPPHGQRSPDSVGATTVRIELFVQDPKAVAARAVAAGAVEIGPVVEHQYETVGVSPIRKMLQGAIRDPFGHIWLTGKFLD